MDKTVIQSKLKTLWDNRNNWMTTAILVIVTLEFFF